MGGEIELKGNGLMDMNNSVVIAGGKGIRGINGNGKNTMKKVTNISCCLRTVLNTCEVLLWNMENFKQND